MLPLCTVTCYCKPRKSRRRRRRRRAKEMQRILNNRFELTRVQTAINTGTGKPGQTYLDASRSILPTSILRSLITNHLCKPKSRVYQSKVVYALERKHEI